MARFGKCLNVDDLRRLASRRLPRPIRSYLEGGSDDEVTLARNQSTFRDFALLPRSMQNVEQVDGSARVLGTRVEWPLVVAPTGMPVLFHPSGEIGLARAARDSGALYTLSTMASQSIEEVSVAVGAPMLFQLYVFRDRGLTRDLIKRARAAGFAGLMLTVDVQVPANRERDKRCGMIIPPRPTLRTVLEFARKPKWCLDILLNGPFRLANFSGARATPGTSLLQFITDQFDPSTTWKDLEWVAKEWGGPIAIKGILRASDALEALRSGASAVVVSNHGGRQLDSVAAPMDVLAEIRHQVGDTGEIIVDGGIRRGTDMLKAISLGADACMTGRPGLYGLAAGGEAGARHAFKLLRSEYERGMALLGSACHSDIDETCVTRVSDSRCRSAPHEQRSIS